MRQYSRVITLVGGVVALISFAFPWDDDHTGVELANSSYNNSDIGFVLIVLIATLIIIVSSLVLNGQTSMKVKLSKTIVTICSCIGLFCFIIMLFGERWNVDIYSNSVGGNRRYSEAFEIQYGAFINAVGFIIAIVGTWNYPKTGDLSDSDEGERTVNTEKEKQ